MFFQRWTIFLLISMCMHELSAQHINIAAGKMKGIKVNGREVQHLEGNVRFEQSGNTVNCDFADYDIQEEELTGFGHVRILSSEGVEITGNNLVYNNKTKIARVDGGVRLTDKDMTLITPWINYNTETRIGWYGSGGKITDKEMVLTSGTGSYNPALKMMYFRKNVVLKHPEYNILADTLQYNSATGTSYFFSYTEIQSDSATILCNYGEYNGKTGKSFFTRNAAILSKENIIRADTLSYNRNTGVGEAWGRLWVMDTVQKITIFGQRGYYNRKNKYTRVTGKPLARQYEKNGDSLMLKADTFIYIDDSLNNSRILHAFHHTSLWRTDFSGTSDSMVYYSHDSMFRLYGQPVLWNSNTRLNADTMRIQMKESRVSQMQMRGNSFVSTREDEMHYSQISGKNMNNYFGSDNKLRLVHVTENGQSIYFIKEKDSVVSSANVVNCNAMKIFLDSGKVDNVRFYSKPEGNLYPLDQLPEDKRVLKGFLWDEENRPGAEAFTPPFVVPGLPRQRENQVVRERNP